MGNAIIDHLMRRALEDDRRRAPFWWEAHPIADLVDGLPPLDKPFVRQYDVFGIEHLLREIPAEQPYRFVLVPADRSRAATLHWEDILPGDLRIYEHVVHERVNVNGERGALLDKALIGRVFADGRERCKVLYPDGDWFAMTWEPTSDAGWIGTTWHREAAIAQHFEITKEPSAHEACRAHMRE